MPKFYAAFDLMADVIDDHKGVKENQNHCEDNADPAKSPRLTYRCKDTWKADQCSAQKVEAQLVHDVLSVDQWIPPGRFRPYENEWGYGS